MEITTLTDKLPWHKTRKWDQRNVSIISRIIIHQQAGKGGIEAINTYHITPSNNNHLSKRGAPHFAYHFGIRKNGEVCQCNRYEDITWHTPCGQNKISIGIMLEGDFKGYEHNGGEPTQEQMDSLGQLVPYLQKEFKLDNQAIFGHYHFGKPACPGDTVQAWIQKLRGTSPTAIDTVTDVQMALNALGYACGKPDGLYGPSTEAAVRDFQSDHGLLVDGDAGPKTKAKLEETLSRS